MESVMFLDNCKKYQQGGVLFFNFGDFSGQGGGTLTQISLNKIIFLLGLIKKSLTQLNISKTKREAPQTNFLVIHASSRRILPSSIHSRIISAAPL